ncbi:hypothetical protein RM780_10675 [Streptomyces sp. DSM 44917]|uniref:Uncharacterized protein n=1 Tax=Streptomyces boetiae TaxID=3075541 RepID=A0ABU2L790_9ACTN|nr:hypothetical protein [Streptomyces sp. DSM 44917]MDT0307427.1 hypothetical protein [Streptomyces sp. DSM 44917]
MADVTRLVTHVELDGDAPPGRRSLSVSARLEAVLTDGRTVVLLNDRGWTSSLSGEGPPGWITAEEIEETARTVVGPDEPGEDQTHVEATAAHWRSLAATLTHAGAPTAPETLERLPRTVHLGPRLRAWLG